MKEEIIVVIGLLLTNVLVGQSDLLLVKQLQNKQNKLIQLKRIEE